MSAPASLVATAFVAGSSAAFFWKAPARYEVVCPEVACGGCLVHCPPVSCSVEPVGSPGFWTGLLLGALVGSLVVFIVAYGVVCYYTPVRPATGQAAEPATVNREDLAEHGGPGSWPATYAIRA